MKNLIKSVISMMLVTLIILLTTNTSYALDDTKNKREVIFAKDTITKNVEFSDIENHWGKDYIKTVCSYGIMNGREDNKFDPNGEVSIAQLIKISAMILSAFTKEDIAVTEGAWFEPYYDYLNKYKLIDSDVYKLASMNATATRYEMAQFINDAYFGGFRILLENNNKDNKDLVPTSKESKYSPVDCNYLIGYVQSNDGKYSTENAEKYKESIVDEIDERYVKAVSQLWSLGIISGDCDGNFNGQENVTRAELCTIICKVLNLK